MCNYPKLHAAMHKTRISKNDDFSHLGKQCIVLSKWIFPHPLAHCVSHHRIEKIPDWNFKTPSKNPCSLHFFIQNSKVKCNIFDIRHIQKCNIDNNHRRSFFDSNQKNASNFIEIRCLLIHVCNDGSIGYLVPETWVLGFGNVLWRNKFWAS